ncbi:hypothetical protein MPTK1_7g16350 [Marchantia polymorpha subsp. ruderalis]|uniref:Uncharacterized protein n=2 Tax=Marchantia polymorpha TaxID=3197 RepID=A0AAF6C0B7_MARPO|nr:hypothetical protein MARPO_0123s0017 [Marchantia polymorpha]BBN17701.1 hypothetical protein Mp_7g16350 [Marchantia polymorpha subsp. ruderalis]|eukprot:PTQ30524.1 hypothetical protein MARPO_0123s0017 [Marchantia polymorpha]
MASNCAEGFGETVQASGLMELWGLCGMVDKGGMGGGAGGVQKGTDRIRVREGAGFAKVRHWESEGKGREGKGRQGKARGGSRRKARGREGQRQGERERGRGRGRKKSEDDEIDGRSAA